MTVSVQDDLETSDDAEQVGEIEITQMRDAKDLAFHRTLAVGDDGAETLTEFLDDDAGIHTAWGFHCGNRSPRRFRGEQFESEFLRGGASGAREQLGILNEIRHA